ncbi:MAG: GntR family transcriptional regulator [Oscillospiraceae bacterium]
MQLIRYERWCCTTISINYRDPRPIYEQVRDGLRRLIVSGTLPLGEKLPSVRELSTQLTINPNTIQRAYRELETEGYICSVAGRGSYVCVQIPDDPARQDALLQQFDAAVQELLYLGMRSEELRRRIPEGGTNHD